LSVFPQGREQPFPIGACALMAQKIKFGVKLDNKPRRFADDGPKSSENRSLTYVSRRKFVQNLGRLKPRNRKTIL